MTEAARQLHLLPVVADRKPSLVQIGERAVSTRGWTTTGAMEHLEWHLGLPLSEQFCMVGCLARTMYGLKTKQNIKRVRANLRRLFAKGLETGLFVVIEHNIRGKAGRGEAIAARYYVRENAELERLAQAQLDAMKRRREITEGQYRRALALIEPSVDVGD